MTLIPTTRWTIIDGQWVSVPTARVTLAGRDEYFDVSKPDTWAPLGVRLKPSRDVDQALALLRL
jgi:hypothetical protein